MREYAWPRGRGTNGRERSPQRSPGSQAVRFQAIQEFRHQDRWSFVEQQQVAALLQGQRKIQTIAFTTGQHAGELLLVGTLETEGRHIRASVLQRQQPQ